MITFHAIITIILNNILELVILESQMQSTDKVYITVIFLLLVQIKKCDLLFIVIYELYLCIKHFRVPHIAKNYDNISLSQMSE